MKKNLLIVFVTLACIFIANFMVACHSTSSGPNGQGSKKSIAVVVPVTIDAFDRLQAGMKDQLNGLNTEIKSYSAEGDPSKFETVVKSALLSHPDVLVTVGTQMTDTAFGSQFKDQLPTVIAAAISDPKLVDSLTNLGVDPPRTFPVAIISDSPREDIYGLLAKTIPRINPQITQVGVIYNLAEKNSKATAEGVIKAVQANSMTALSGILTGPDDVSKVTQDLLLKGAQIIVIPHDKYAVEKAATIAQLSHGRKVPTISLDDGTVKKSGVMAAVSVDYGKVGAEVGQVIAEILSGKARAQDIPVTSLQKASVYLNEDVARNLGIAIPHDLKQEAVIAQSDK